MSRSLRFAASVAALLLTATTLHADSRAKDFSPDGVWLELDAAQVSRRAGAIGPRVLTYRPVAVDLDLFMTTLRSAPMEFEQPLQDSETILWLPTPEGDYQRFQVEEAPLLAPHIAAEFPHHRAWRGQGIDDPTATLTLVYNDLGVTAQVLSAYGHWYIDPLEHGRADVYAVYTRADMDPEARPSFRCQFDPGIEPELPELQPLFAEPRSSNMMRYRIAIAATGEYTTFHGGVTSAFSALQVSLARVRGLYERDLSITFNLVSGTSIVFPNAASDPYTVPNVATMLGQNQTTIDTNVGSANYDVGHVFYQGTGGGIAGFGVVCTAGQKARGVTGTDFPVGDSFDVDYVAHELGHQFRANHTFNSANPDCAAQRNASTSVEPGSGSTIMAYAGICPPDNVQTFSDAMFSYISLTEIRNYVMTGGGSGCKVNIPNSNVAPTVTAPPNKTIPRQTPFELTATGSDPNGDAITFSWEQSNAGSAAANLTAADNGVNPRYRAFLPVTTPTRSFPRLQTILTTPSNSSNVENAFTAASTNRRFTVTVRDNNASGGLFAQATTILTIDSTKGPFTIDSPNTNVLWTVGETRTVTWTPEHPTAPIAANVDIFLSTDGGTTFPITIASGVPNNGSHTFTVPNNPSNSCRLKIKASDNYFFDINGSNFRIQAAADTTPPTPVFSTTAPNPTNLAAIPFTVNFGENINNSTFTTSDITLTGTASSGASVSGLTAVTGTQIYNFNVNMPITANGTITVNMAAGAVQDLAGNPSTAATPLTRTSDRVAPTATSFAPVLPSTGVQPVEFDITFSEQITGLTPSAVVVSGSATGTPSVTVTPITPGISFRIGVSGFVTPGTVTVGFTAGAIQDLAGNNFNVVGVNSTANYTGATDATGWTAYE